MSKPSVCLQINFAAADVRYAPTLLRHQVKVLGDQVDEIRLTLDTNQNRASRASTDDFTVKLALLREVLTQFRLDDAKIHVDEVDYSAECMSKVSRELFAGRAIPNKSCDGSPFYAYLFGLSRVRSDYVLHLDSDILLGGGSKAWVSEAIEILESHPGVFACFPFPGPPNHDNSPPKRRLTAIWDEVSFSQKCYPSNLQRVAFRFNEISSRTFLIDRRRLASGQVEIPLVYPRISRRIRAALLDLSPYLCFEDSLTTMINEYKLGAIAFLGSGDGLWSLHIRYRSEALYDGLIGYVHMIENNAIPDGQRGDFDMNGAMIDWHDPTRGRRSRYPREFKLAVNAITRKLLQRDR